jgi:hypothetical protein
LEANIFTASGEARKVSHLSFTFLLQITNIGRKLFHLQLSKCPVHATTILLSLCCFERSIKGEMKFFNYTACIFIFSISLSEMRWLWLNDILMAAYSLQCKTSCKQASDMLTWKCNQIKNFNKSQEVFRHVISLMESNALPC